MSLLDILIIYLACGSPFSVYQITKTQPISSVPYMLSIVGSFIFWPGYAISLLFKYQLSSRTSPAILRSYHVEEIRIKIEQIAFSDSSISALFDFREVFYRYTGLLEFSHSLPLANGTMKLFEISRHKNLVLASKCLARRNRIRLGVHTKRAQFEFIETVSVMASRLSTDRDKLIGLAIELSDNFGGSLSIADFRIAASATPSSGIPVSASTRQSSVAG